MVTPSIVRLIDHLEFGPFSTSYHRDLVTAAFKEQLEYFLQQNLLPQLDSPLREFEGSLIPTFDSEANCGPNSLVRDIFTLECTLVCDDGVSEFKSDIVYDLASESFTPRTGHRRSFYVWTPTRRSAREEDLSAIQCVVDAIMRGERRAFECPMCGGKIIAVNNPHQFDARCASQGCFEYNFHKDDRGRLAHGHFFTNHPA